MKKILQFKEDNLPLSDEEKGEILNLLGYEKSSYKIDFLRYEDDEIKYRLLFHNNSGGHYYEKFSGYMSIDKIQVIKYILERVDLEQAL